MFIEVGEEGAESAATSVEPEGVSGLKPSIIINHPFIHAIRGSYTGAVRLHRSNVTTGRTTARLESDSAGPSLYNIIHILFPTGAFYQA